MERNLQTKLLATLMASALAVTIFIPHTVKAMNSGEIVEEQTNISMSEILDSNEKIMCYDATTNETTEVSIEELRKELNSQEEKNVNNLDGGYSKSELPAILPKNTSIHRMKELSVNLLSASPYSNSTLKRVTDTSYHPYRTVCRVEGTFPNGNPGYGTAAVVAPKAVLTCAHCVFDKESGETLKNWAVCAGFYIKPNSYIGYYGKKTGWSKVYYSNIWMNERKSEYDWALCILGDDIGQDAGCFGINAFSDSSNLNNLDVKALGYPTEKAYGFEPDGWYQYEATGTITNVFNNYFWYAAQTFEGFSGGPIIRPSDNHIVGINQGRNGDKSLGVRITQSMIDLIREYRQ